MYTLKSDDHEGNWGADGESDVIELAGVVADDIVMILCLFLLSLRKHQNSVSVCKLR